MKKGARCRRCGEWKRMGAIRPEGFVCADCIHAEKSPYLPKEEAETEDSGLEFKLS